MLCSMTTPTVYTVACQNDMSTQNTIVSAVKTGLDLAKQQAIAVANLIPAEAKIADPHNAVDKSQQFVSDLFDKSAEATRHVVATQMKLAGDYKSNQVASYVEQALSIQKQILQNAFEIQKMWFKA